MFSCRHYVAIAEALQSVKPEKPILKNGAFTSIAQSQLAARGDQHKCVVDQLANVFTRDSPAFNRDRFLRAAGEDV